MRHSYQIYGFLRAIGALALIAATAIAAGVAFAAEPLSITGARIGVHPDKTRFVLELSRRADYTLTLLPDPYRLVIDMPEFAWSAGGSEKSGDGLIARYRSGVFQPGQSRIVLDVEGPVAIRDAFHIPPREGHSHRLVIDLVKTSREAFVAAMSRHKSEPRSAASLRPKPAPASPPPATGRQDARPVIVIDPGHGGVDPGTIGGSGVHEKIITLATGLELKRRLDATGRYRVYLTRAADVSVGLRDRVSRARTVSADLFLSIHADSIADGRVRGATVYTLSETSSDREAAELAAKENKADLILGIDLGQEAEDVTSILIDLAQRETMNFSARFANLLVPEIGKRATLRRNSHRFAGFRVLKAPDVPSVLLELGYLSNADDERLLKSPEGRGAIAEAIKEAAEHYFSQRLTMKTP